MSRDEATVLDILNAARRAVDFCLGLDRASFQADPKIYFAVLHQFTIIGEAAKRLTDAFRSSHPEFPWKDMAGMRDVLVHRYDDVSPEEVWKAVVEDLPQLIRSLEAIATSSE
ncbi:MAG: DUF86 domain-containing protein [Acidobacteria bacterium]|nr:DUF86 domain-containing protein [Acidobacteriota bacterium]